TAKVRYRKERLEFKDGGKTFYFNPKKRGGSEPLLYGAENLPDIPTGQPVYVVEGEKCVDRIRELGAIAISGDTGETSRWLPAHGQLFRGLQVILCQIAMNPASATSQTPQRLFGPRTPAPISES